MIQSSAGVWESGAWLNAHLRPNACLLAYVGEFFSQKLDLNTIRVSECVKQGGVRLAVDFEVPS